VTAVKTRKKLIEVALPLEAINAASAREKSIRHGHPSTLHLYWARRPLATARAVIFAQMVDDPSANPDLFPTEQKQNKERQRLFRIIENLVKWENTTNEEVLQSAREEIWQSWRRACADNADHPQAKELFNRQVLPAFHDPFAGGGALPLEAQRLGLESYATDLNPVAVMINKAMIEIPPKFAGKPPVNPEARGKRDLVGREWKGARGLADDVRYYGEWMRTEAQKRIGHLYPKIKITAATVRERPDLVDYLDQELTVIAWLWARTVKSPNPAYNHVDVPLVSTFMLTTKEGREAYVEPVFENNGYRFSVKIGKPDNKEAAKNGTKLARGANFACLMSKAPIASDYIKSEGRAGRMGARMMAIVAEGSRGRVYLSPLAMHESVVNEAKPTWRPDTLLANDPRALWTPAYGLTKYGDLFTERQLVVLTTFSDLVAEVRNKIKTDAVAAGLLKEGKPLRDKGHDALAYGEAVSVYLAFALDKVVDRGTTVCRWDPTPTQSGIINTFSRQAIPMSWDFAESNPIGDASGNFVGAAELVAKVLESMPLCPVLGSANQDDASTQSVSSKKVVSTDPPYYDNIGYADLSDFFYVWMSRSLKISHPELFATLAVPKAEELVATPYRHGGKDKAEKFFLDGMTQAMHRLATQSHPAFPVTIYYAFKQSESDEVDGTTNTGWDTFLAAVIEAGFALTGTWPMRTELSNRMIGTGNNALASSIVLVCQKRSLMAPVATKAQFLEALRVELPLALINLQAGNIAPVDLAQASIGPGMAIYTRFSKVVGADGSPMSVREALAQINEVLDEQLAEQEGNWDADTRWGVTWFEQNGFTAGEFGLADQLARAKNTSVAGVVQAGFVASQPGKVRIFKPEELPADWDPLTDSRLTVWEMLHHLIRVYKDGEAPAAALMAKLGDKADAAKELAYRLYGICEKKKRSTEGQLYNEIITIWPDLVARSKEAPAPTARPGELNLDN
jgi:putative DNA methylase